MKRCPKCGTTYTDETLRFCLADGSVLEHAAVAAGGQMRVEIPQPAPRPNYEPATPTEKGGPSVLKILLVVALFGGLIVIGIAGAGALIYFNKDTKTAEPNAAKKEDIRPATTPAAANSDTDKLREQIANLEKRLDEQMKSGQPSNVPLSIPDMPKTATTTATVNSPDDGFLALRTLPNSEMGSRIMKIPHGATVSIGACGPSVRPVKRAGRWCQARYDGQTGWVFDAYLIY